MSVWLNFYGIYKRRIMHAGSNWSRPQFKKRFKPALQLSVVCLHRISTYLEDSPRSLGVDLEKERERRGEESVTRVSDTEMGKWSSDPGSDLLSSWVSNWGWFCVRLRDSLARGILGIFVFAVKWPYIILNLIRRSKFLNFKSLQLMDSLRCWKARYYIKFERLWKE